MAYRDRIRRVTKIGNNTYYTQSWSVGSFILSRMLIPIIKFPFFLLKWFLIWPLWLSYKEFKALVLGANSFGAKMGGILLFIVLLVISFAYYGFMLSIA